jgi:hypothetical protein
MFSPLLSIGIINDVSTHLQIIRGLSLTAKIILSESVILNLRAMLLLIFVPLSYNSNAFNGCTIFPILAVHV